MHAGDCVLQPPHIRHRVLECADGLEVIEISSPAEHMTLFDHEMRLPTGRHLPQSGYAGQRFVFHQASGAHWSDEAGTGWTCRDLGISAATDGLASARVLRQPESGERSTRAAQQDKSFAFAFVLDGSMSLHAGSLAPEALTTGDAFVIPSGMPQTFANCSANWALLQFFAPA
jgi:quercetin dioxygenase-like cupin family protein